MKGEEATGSFTFGTTGSDVTPKTGTAGNNNEGFSFGNDEVPTKPFAFSFGEPLKPEEREQQQQQQQQQQQEQQEGGSSFQQGFRVPTASKKVSISDKVAPYVHFPFHMYFNHTAFHHLERVYCILCMAF